MSEAMSQLRLPQEILVCRLRSLSSSSRNIFVALLTALINFRESTIPPKLLTNAVSFTKSTYSHSA
jgi:hypothetical protein